MKRYRVKKGETVLELKNHNLKYDVTHYGFQWTGEGRASYILFQKKILGKYVWLPQRFSWAKNKSHRVCGDKIISTYSGFRILGEKRRLKLVVTAHLIEAGQVKFSIEAFHEEGMNIKSIYFPQPFNGRHYESEKAYSVDPRRQGILLPDKHKVNRKAIFLMTKYWRSLNSGEAYMPVWGRVCGKQGYAAIADNAYDLSLFSSYGKKKAFLTSPNWYGQHGKVGYQRRMYYTFYQECDYVTIAKAYRKKLIDEKKFVTLEDKIKANPHVAKLIGTPVIHWRTLENKMPKSKGYVKGGENQVLHHSFDASAKLFKRFYAAGLTKAYVHLDGWGQRGYDNLHPDVLPPNPQAGGYEGLKALADTCRQQGYIFGLHDQYRDFYMDSPAYKEEQAVVNVNGKKPYCDEWDGGAHHLLCSCFAQEYVKKTYETLAQKGVDIQGVYLDVFSVQLGDECYHPNHPVTRRESIQYRGECFAWLRDRGLIVSSEEPGHQMIHALDLVHHGPYGVTPQEKGVAIGIPIPFFNLVYHECVFVPWLIEGTGGWGIPNGDAGKLHCILNGQSPYFNNSMKAETYNEAPEVMAEHIQSAMEVAAINAKVYNAEMVEHKFLDGSYRKQQAKYSNGYVITVDFEAGTYDVTREENRERI